MTDETASAAPAKDSAPPAADNVFVGELAGSIAPIPTRMTVFLRTFMPYQAYRFARVNLKMLRMMRRSHGQ